jgi:hypothetical protein
MATSLSNTCKNHGRRSMKKAQHSEELGMYWKLDAGYRFFELPIETQALLIECFAEIKGDPNAINEMRLWLMKNKQNKSLAKY